MRTTAPRSKAIKLKPRVLVDVSKRSQEITLFGRKQAMPIIVAPTGSAGLAWYEGEIALARAAAAAGIPFTLADRLDDRAGEGRRGGRRHAVVPVLHVARPLALARAHRARARGRIRGARLHRGHAGRARARVQPAQRLHDPVHVHPRATSPTCSCIRAGSSACSAATCSRPACRATRTSRPRRRPRITALPMGRSTALNDSMTWDDVRELRRLWPRQADREGHTACRAMRCSPRIAAPTPSSLSNHGGRVLDSALRADRRAAARSSTR